MLQLSQVYARLDQPEAAAQATQRAQILRERQISREEKDFHSSGSPVPKKGPIPVSADPGSTGLGPNS